MNPEYPYPSKEHYVFPQSPVDVMDEFMELYEPGEDSVKYVMALSRLYANVPFLHFMQEHARLIEIASVEASDRPVSFDSMSHDSNFLAGSVMAIHVNTYGASDLLRARVLSQNPLKYLRTAPDCEEKYEVIQDCVRVMREWDEKGAQVLFDDQTEEFKEKLWKVDYHDL